MNITKNLIKNTFRKFGLEIIKFNPSASPAAQIVSSFCHFKIDMVFDVGANIGQFASSIRNAGYAGKIISFEPLSLAHANLKIASTGDAMWDIHSRCALGAKNGEIEINIAGNSESSSVLPILNSHLLAASNTA